MSIRKFLMKTFIILWNPNLLWIIEIKTLIWTENILWWMHLIFWFLLFWYFTGFIRIHSLFGVLRLQILFPFVWNYTALNSNVISIIVFNLIEYLCRHGDLGRESWLLIKFTLIILYLKIALDPITYHQTHNTLSRP